MIHAIKSLSFKKVNIGVKITNQLFVHVFKNVLNNTQIFKNNNELYPCYFYF